MGTALPAGHVRLLCIPHAGGSPSAFDGWQERLPRTVAVEPVCLPGHGARATEPPLERLVPLAEQLAEELRPSLDGPFALLGHSMGGLLAFELARALRRAGGPSPGLVAACGVRAPHVPLPRTPLHRLSDEQLIGHVARLGQVPPVLRENRSLLKLYLPTLRADLRAYETYAYECQEPLDVPILAIGGTHDPLVSPQTLTAWGQHTTAGVRVRMVRGDHFFLHAERATVLRLLDADLSLLAAGT